MTVQLLVRYAVAASGTRRYGLKRFKFSYAKLLLATGGLIVLSQFADFLYAPVNQLLIKANLGTSALAIYAPTLHVDGALLLLVSGLGTLLLPLASLAKSEKRFDTLRSYYVWGTIGSFVMLATGAVVACSIDGWLFTRWLGDPFPATQAILPLVMIHTVVGGTASVGRAVLIGMGRIKAYAISTLIGGGVNVLLAMLLLNYTDLGLFGIIYATIFTVTARCLIWMPIYTLWVIRRGASLDRRA
jgi:membrane protein EpsK